MGLNIGTLYVRRSIFIQAPPSRVWQEFSSEERIKGWLNLGHKLLRLDPQVGGEAEFSVDIDGKEHRFGGKVLVVEPERELSLESQWYGEFATPLPTFWTIRLTSIYGGTLVELFDHGYETLGADAADAVQDYEGGWDTKHLVALRAIVEK